MNVPVFRDYDPENPWEVSGETKTIGSDGRIRLDHVPFKGSGDQAVSIAGYTETTSATPGAGEFYIDYMAESAYRYAKAYVQFNVSQAGRSVTVHYYGVKTILTAAILNEICNKVANLENNVAQTAEAANAAEIAQIAADNFALSAARDSAKATEKATIAETAATGLTEAAETATEKAALSVTNAGVATTKAGEAVAAAAAAAQSETNAAGSASTATSKAAEAANSASLAAGFAASAISAVLTSLNVSATAAALTAEDTIKSGIEKLYAWIKKIFALTWTEKFLLSSPAAGFVSPYSPLSRNGTLSAVCFYPKGTPASATTINLMHGTGNTIAAALTSGATSATLASTITLSAATNMLIDDEVVLVTAIGGTTLAGTAITGTALTITRAQGGTTAAAHDSGTATLLQIATASLSAKSPVAVTGLSVPGTARDLIAYHVAGGGLASIPVTTVQEWGNR